MVKKRGTGSPIVAALKQTTTIHQTNMAGFCIFDKVSNSEFLVDTGALASVYPATEEDRRAKNTQHKTITLTAANGTRINTYAQRELKLCFHNHTYRWKFIIADVDKPLLGADFLRAHDLLVDVNRCKLIDAMSLQPVPSNTTRSSATNEVQFVNSPSTNIVQEFTNIFKPELQHKPGDAAKHGVSHFIQTTGRPVHQKFRRLSPKKLQIAKDYFTDMVRMGICKREASAWGAPLHMVKKTGRIISTVRGLHTPQHTD